MPPNDLIFQRLHAATEAELAALAAALDEKLIGERAADIALLSQELRADAGSAFANRFRGPHDLSYRDILEDVAVKAADAAGWTAPSITAAATELKLEDYIVQAFVFAKRREDASEADKVAAQNAAEREIIGTASPSEAATFTRVASILASTIFRAHPLVLTGGTVFFAGAAIAWIASGAMRRVVPAVLVLIHVRARTEAEQMLTEAA